MTHTKIVIDSDTHFLIDAATRQIRNTASSKISVMQNDHNSERLTFSIPRFIEGHDMSTSDKIEIHYINVDATSKDRTTGIYEPDDVKIETSGDSEVVTCSWLLSRNATKHVGSLTFVVRFACFTDGVVDYDWHTAPFSGISVGETLDCSGAIEGEYLDIIAAWEKEHIEPLHVKVAEHQIAIEKMQEQSTIIATASSNTPIYDVDVNGGVNTINFYGYTKQTQGATLSTPKGLVHSNGLNVMVCCDEYYFMAINGSTQPLLTTNNYRDSGWVDLVNNKIHYKRHIKKIVLDGTETYTKGNKTYTPWVKASSPEGRYFVNLHLIDGLFTAEDLSRIDKGTPIAYDDAKCTIGNEYFYGNFTESGQFNITQGTSSSSSYFRFQFYASEFNTLDEVLAYVQKNPITLFIPMIYEVYEEEFDFSNGVKLIKDNIKNPFKLYFYDRDNPIYSYPTEVTYKVDVGLAMQNIKNAIIALGGNV